MTGRLIIINAGQSPTFSTGATTIACSDGVISALGNNLEIEPTDQLIDARGGAVIAGLRDHHMHLLATAAARHSVDCATLQGQSLPDAVAARCALEDATNGTAHGLRVVNYHESMHGALNRNILDTWAPAHPLRVQHATGKIWYLNTPALIALNLLDRSHTAIERDASGSATGVIVRGDDLLRGARRADEQAPDLTALSRELASFGVTGVTDTSYHNTTAERELLGDKQSRGELVQRLRVMGSEHLTAVSTPMLHTGELKVLLDEANLPDLDDLEQKIRKAHSAGRSVAVHCVTAIELAVTLGAFTATGVLNDRIEHASVVPAANLTQLAESGLQVITQPGLIHNRGDRYLDDLTASECAALYRLNSLITSNIPLALSSDAPYGPLNPWLNMSCAVARQTETGQLVSPEERLTPEHALLGYSGSLARPTMPSTLNLGAAADLAILDSPWPVARRQLDQVSVQATLRAGEVIFERTTN